LLNYSERVTELALVFTVAASQRHNALVAVSVCIITCHAKLIIMAYRNVVILLKTKLSTVSQKKCFHLICARTIAVLKFRSLFKTVAKQVYVIPRPFESRNRLKTEVSRVSSLPWCYLYLRCPPCLLPALRGPAGSV